MNINWKVRFKNPIFIVGKFLPFLLFAAQALLGIVDVFHPIGYEITDAMTNEVMRRLNIVGVALITLTAPVDDTTFGFGDSKRARTYKKPREDL